MSDAPKVSREEYAKQMKGEMEDYLASVIDAVNEAPDGAWIAGSEEQVRDLSAEFRRRVCPNILAVLSGSGARGFPIELPLAAPLQAVQGGDGSRVGAIPASTAAFQAAHGQFALGFRRTAADLPAVGEERRVANHLLPLRYVVQQSIGSLAFLRRATQLGTPLHQPFPGGVIAVVFERVHQLMHPRFSLGGVLAEHHTPRAMHIFTQVIEVQTQAIQFRYTSRGDK